MKADAKGLVLAILGDLSARARNEISNVLQDGADSPDHSRAGTLRRAVVPALAAAARHPAREDVHQRQNSSRPLGQAGDQ
jgi:hypothetical protein